MRTGKVLVLILIFSEVLGNTMLMAKVYASRGARDWVDASTVFHGTAVWPCAQASVTLCIRNQAVEKDDGVTEAMQFSVSLLFCVYGCVCISYVLLFHISQTALQTRKSLCVCRGGRSCFLCSPLDQANGWAPCHHLQPLFPSFPHI